MGFLADAFHFILDRGHVLAKRRFTLHIRRARQLFAVAPRVAEVRRVDVVART